MKKICIVTGLLVLVLAAGCQSAAETQMVESTESDIVEPTAAEEVEQQPEPTPVPTESPTSEPETSIVEEKVMMNLESIGLVPNEAIPVEYTCDGDDTSPPLTWGDPPDETASYALIMDDPDAPVGTWDHWLLFNIPAEARELPAGITDDAEFSDGSRHGNNSWKRVGYGGPCPPSGTHRYFFKLYALDTILDLEPGVTSSELMDAIEGHILAEAELMGTYTR